MKTLAYVLGFLLLFLSVGQAEMFRKTASDLYQESYQAQMERLGGMSAAEVRAGEYVKVYERCDVHHNCASLTDGRGREYQNEKFVLFAYVPVWQ